MTATRRQTHAERDAAGATPAPRFGLRIVFDLYGCEADVDDPDLILKWKDRLIRRIRMEQYGAPFLERFAEHDPVAAGFSLAQMITTSLVDAHFSPHPEMQLVSASVFSCREFDPLDALGWSERFWRATESVYTITRH